MPTSSFTWIPLYRELAAVVVEYEVRQAELLAVWRELKERGLPLGTTAEQGPAGPRELDVVDPFTFFSLFNRAIRDDNRTEVLRALKEHFKLKGEVPTAFPGIPYSDNRNNCAMAAPP